MKTNDYLLLTATGAYSFLFYQQNAGINFLIFNIIFLAVLIIKNQELLKNKKWWWAAVMCLISSACVFIHSSDLSVLANVFSVLLVSALSFNTQTSSIFSFWFSTFSILSSIVFIMIDTITRLQPKPEEEGKKMGYKLVASLIVLVISVLFFVMYQQANPLFAENTKWINLDFISLRWIFFTFGGFLLMYGLFYHRTIKPIESWENNLSLSNKVATIGGKEKQYETERFAGLLLFVMLKDRKSVG